MFACKSGFVGALQGFGNCTKSGVLLSARCAGVAAQNFVFGVTAINRGGFSVGDGAEYGGGSAVKGGVKLCR
jgi:hypothetical protein